MIITSNVEYNLPYILPHILCERFEKASLYYETYVAQYITV